MYCKNCGSEVSDNASVCIHCGASIQPTSTKVEGRPPKSYLIFAILVTIFCCLPFGIVGIVYANKVEDRFYAGDMEGALRASSTAKMWTLIGFLCGLGAVILYVVLYAVLGVAIFSQYSGDFSELSY
ncbi:MAG: CD225/dispanin family protein [Prevotellaceae bacterium]|jgi:hypothetical protein|nr:CD225/dispanin family protein [Prevotellaceae bacterium]